MIPIAKFSKVKYSGSFKRFEMEGEESDEI
jgi:hypothetical protein